MKTLKSTIMLMTLMCVMALSYSDSLGTITKGTEYGMEYYIFDEIDSALPVLKNEELTMEETKQSPLLMDIGEQGVNWYSFPTIKATFKGKVPSYIKPNGETTLSSRTVNIEIKYANEKNKDSVSRVNFEDVDSLVEKEWLSMRQSLDQQYDGAIEQATKDTRSHMFEEQKTPEIMHYISGPEEKQESQLRLLYHGYHYERYGQFIISIRISGSWSDEFELSPVMKALVEYSKELADRADGRANQYLDMFTDVEKTEVAAEESSDQEEEKEEGLLTQASGYLYFNRVDLQGSPNQRLIVGVYDSKNVFVEMQETLTEEDGSFVFLFEKPLEKGSLLKFSAPLSYHKSDGTGLFIVTDGRLSETKATVIECGGGEYQYDGGVVLNNIKISLAEGRILGREKSDLNAYNQVGFYAIMQYGVEYYHAKLNFEYEDSLPIKLIMNTKKQHERLDAAAFYDPETSSIHVMEASSHVFGVFTAETIFHELSHHVMYDAYENQFPAGPDDVSHGGYANVTSGNSLTEGFAYFMSSKALEEMNYKYSLVRYEADLKAWQENGFAEEQAIAGVFQDLIDKGIYDDDTVEISVEKFWGHLKDYCPDFGVFYVRLKEAYSNDKTIMEGIDSIFKNHGFYVVMDKLDTGVGTWEFGEAFLDKNMNFKWDKGEPVRDYNAIGPNGANIQEYRPEYEIGRAAYADNTLRYTGSPTPWHRIKTIEEYPWYQVEVKFTDKPELDYSYETIRMGDKLDVLMPPAGYDATITVRAQGDEVISSEELVITTALFRETEEVSMEQGYFVDHDFKVKLTTDKKSISLFNISILFVVIIGVVAILLFTLKRKKNV